MWKLKNQEGARRRAKKASNSKTPIEYLYQEWIAEPKWIVHMEPKGSIPTQVPYRKKS